MNNESRIREKFSRPGRARERKTTSGRGFWGMGTDYRALRRARVGPSLRPLAQHVDDRPQLCRPSRSNGTIRGEMIAKMVDVIERDDGAFRNLLPQSSEAFVRAEQARARERQQ
ncbi:hypothetical protein [Burkholderia sp. 22313]|uniref:hypothetical protein n=1 Tax=Burkholderia sp. 22313 TaxID=3453908 RepID=UPI003F859694